jgi:hypothetical protein
VPQPLPFAQRLAGAQGPPQSASVSEPFFTVSAQVGAAQVRLAAGHTAFTQSVPSLHALPSSQRGQVGPPQSMSVSVPFFTPSAQLLSLQSPPEQLPLSQSVPLTHIFPAAHGPQVAPPPQSTSVSEAFMTLSVHDGAVQAPSVQTRLVQSPPVLQ